MARITVVLDEIIDMSQSSQSGEPRPAKAVALCELAGAGGVAIDIKDITPRHERIIKSIKEVLAIPLALIIPADDKTVEKVIDLAPGLVVLCDCLPGSEAHISRLQVANIIVAVEVSPEVSQVKAAAKMKADYAAIDVSSFCVEKNLAARVDVINKIAKVSALAERLSMGVIMRGAVTIADLSKLAEIEQAEDFFIGHELISKAMLYGLEKAMTEFRAVVS